ncbi:hypothetical protein ACVWZA_003944 [Sphingomonas sp. UYAg733]
MNALTSIVVAKDLRWEEAIASVNTWRGTMIHYFTEAETDVSEALLSLAAVRGRGQKVKLRQLIGQRYEDLRSALGPEGPFAVEGEWTLTALDHLREHDALRNILCHGATKIALRRSGDWIIVIKLLTFRKGADERTRITFEQADADALLADLKNRINRLRKELKALREAIMASA